MVSCLVNTVPTSDAPPLYVSVPSGTKIAPERLALEFSRRSPPSTTMTTAGCAAAQPSSFHAYELRSVWMETSCPAGILKYSTGLLVDSALGQEAGADVV